MARNQNQKNNQNNNGRNNGQNNSGQNNNGQNNNGQNNRSVGKKPNSNAVSVKDHVQLKKCFMRYVATTTALFKQKFGTDITEVAKNLDDASKENLQGAKIHTEFNDLDASLVEATQPHSSEIKTYKSFEVLKCLHHPCQKLFLCHRQFKHMSFCDQCRTIRHMPKKCTMCDIKFRPLWNWSIKCRKCRGINTSTFKKCTDCKRPFKTKEIGQKQCKNCIQPQIGKRACQSCSGQFVPQFFSSKNCSICLFRFASKKSAF